MLSIGQKGTATDYKNMLLTGQLNFDGQSKRLVLYENPSMYENQEKYKATSDTLRVLTLLRSTEETTRAATSSFRFDKAKQSPFS